MQNQNSSPRKVTMLTLGAFIVGMSIILINWYILIGLPFLLWWIYNYPKHLIMLQNTLTTFIFGVLDSVCMINIYNYVYNKQYQIPVMSIYIILMTIYYYFQFQLVNNFHHDQLSWQSFLIYHSKQYTIVHIFVILQHITTKYVFKFNYKYHHNLVWFALVIAIIGQILRIMAFFTAQSNFTHIVRFKKVQKHICIKHGIYSILRHPSYTGYFYFSVSLQIMIGNWISAFMFFVILCHFFNQRIRDQEYALMNFFKDYHQYRKNKYILIPFIQDPQYHHKKKIVITQIIEWFSQLLR